MTTLRSLISFYCSDQWCTYSYHSPYREWGTSLLFCKANDSSCYLLVSLQHHWGIRSIWIYSFEWISKPEFWEMNLTIKLAVFFPGMLLVAPLALPPEVDSIKFTKHVKHSFFDSTFLTLGFWMYDLDIGSWYSGQLVLS